MANTHVALYDLVTGAVIQVWARSASDDAADIATNGYLTVDSVVVCEGIDVTKIGAMAFDGPTADDATAPLLTMELDDVGTPTDIVYLTTPGARDGYYFDDYEADGYTLKES